MLKNILKNHCEINEKSMKKRMDFWTDLLIDFWRVSGRMFGVFLGVVGGVLGRFLGEK